MGNADRLIAALSALAADAAARPLAPVSLTEAALRGDVAAVRAFLDGGAPLEERTIGFASPLAAAAGRGHLAACELLLERGASLDPEGSAFPLLTFPIAHRRLDVIELLLRAGAPMAKYRPHFREAVRQGRWDVVDALLAGGADPAWLSDAERERLGAFVARERPRSPEYRQRLRAEEARRLERERVGPSPRPLPEDERRRLEAAAIAEVRRDPALARARTVNGTPVLALAAGAGASRLAQALLGAGADADDGGAAETPLARAAARSDTAVLTVLLEAGADPNRCGAGSPQPLLAAARAGSLAGLELLLQHGARPRARDVRAAIEQAAGADRTRIVARLEGLLAPAAREPRLSPAGRGRGRSRPQAGAKSEPPQRTNRSSPSGANATPRRGAA